MSWNNDTDNGYAYGMVSQANLMSALTFIESKPNVLSNEDTKILLKNIQTKLNTMLPLAGGNRNKKLTKKNKNKHKH